VVTFTAVVLCPSCGGCHKDTARRANRFIARKAVSESWAAERHCCCVCVLLTLLRRRRPRGAFAGNELVTSKYNLLNFVPVNLYHQFKRVANMYFAALVCLQVRGVSLRRCCYVLDMLILWF
jgi:hypothetical protein